MEVAENTKNSLNTQVYDRYGGLEVADNTKNSLNTQVYELVGGPDVAEIKDFGSFIATCAE